MMFQSPFPDDVIKLIFFFSFFGEEPFFLKKIWQKRGKRLQADVINPLVDGSFLLKA